MTPEDVRAIVEALRATAPDPGVTVDLGAALAGLASLLVLVLGWFVRRLVGSFDKLAESVAALARDAVTRGDCARLRDEERARAEELAEARRDAVREAADLTAQARALLRAGGER